MRLKGRRRCIGALALLAMLTVPAVAQAAPHPFLKVAATGTPLGPSTTQLFDDACGLAVDGSARLLVSDYQNGIVAAFATGLAPPPPEKSVFDVAYESQFAAAAQENSACGLAADSSGDLYAANFHQGVVRYSAGIPQPLATGHATGIAVDRSTDSLYVTYRDHVAAYSAPVTPLSVPVSIGAGALSDAFGGAVSGFAATEGYLYVADAADDTVKVFDPATDPLDPVATIDGSGTPPGEFSELTDSSLAVDDSTGHVFVLDNLQPGFEHPAAAVYEFDASGAYVGRLPKPIIHGGPSGLAVDNSANETRGLVYVTSGNEVFTNLSTGIEEGSFVYAFCPTAPISAGLQIACPLPTPTATIEVDRAGSGQGSVTGTGAEISCGVLCATEADLGTSVTLTATAKPHSAFAGWSIAGGTSSCGTARVCKLTLSSAAEATATFTAIPQRQLTVTKDGAGSGAVTSSPVGLSCGSTCVAGFDQGTLVTLNPEPGPGAEFAGWSGACSGTGACKVTLSTDASVGATFRPIERVAPIPPGESLRILAISVSGEGSGTIVSEPGGIECGTPCSAAYAPGATVTLAATPDRESRFVGWAGCDAVAANRCTVTLAASRTVGASFAEAKPKKECKKKKKGGKGGKCKAAKKGKSTKKGKGKR